MSLTNPNTPVSQQDLKDLYEQKILPYIGGAFGLVATGIDSANLYSTTERVIGQWIDGKPLYQKTFTGTSGGNGADATFGSISNAETIVSLRGIVRNSNNMMHGAPNPGLYLKYYNGNIQTYTSDAQFGNQPCSITVQYTKTTDSAVESYGTDTTYSTDEHVVGSWIDGKPVYQKTLTGTAPASSATQNIQIGANVESALVISGYCQHESFLTPVNIQIDSNEYFMAWIRDNSNPNAPNTVGIKAGSALYNGSYRIVIQYTKAS